MDDEDEVGEVKSNARELFGAFGNIISLEFAVIAPEHATIINYSSLTRITFDSADAAKGSVSALHNMVLGGDKIQVYLLQRKISGNDLELPDIVTYPLSQKSEMKIISEPGAILSLCNILQLEDVVDGDEDSIQESLQDILSLCSRFSGPKSISYRTINLSAFSWCEINIVRFRERLIEQYTRRNRVLRSLQGSLPSEPEQAKSSQRRRRTKFKQMRTFSRPLVVLETLSSLSAETTHQQDWSALNSLLFASALEDLQIGGETLHVHRLLRYSSATSYDQPVEILMDEQGKDGEGSLKGTADTDSVLWMYSVVLQADETMSERMITLEYVMASIVTQLSEKGSNLLTRIHIKISDAASEIVCSVNSIPDLFSLLIVLIQVRAHAQESFVPIEGSNGLRWHSMSVFYHHRFVVSDRSPAIDADPEIADTIDNNQNSDGESVSKSVTSPSGSVCTEDVLLFTSSPASMLTRNVATSVTLLLDKYITSDDVLAAIAEDSHEDLVVAKQDLLVILRDRLLQQRMQWTANLKRPILLDSSTNELHPLSLAITAAETLQHLCRVSLLTAVEATQVSFGSKIVDSNVIVVNVQFASISTAQQAMCYFDGLILGGECVSAGISCISHRSELPSAPNPSVSSFETEVTGATVATSAVEESSALIEFIDTLALLYTPVDTHEASASNSLDGILRVVYSESETRFQKNSGLDKPQPADLETNENGEAANEDEGHETEMNVSLRARKVSLYRLAQHMPKQGYHSTPLLPIASATPEINTYAKEFLALLASYQRRLREKLVTQGAALKYKQKMRFVCGLRQATHAVKAGRVKLLLIAPNTEQSSILDGKLLDLVHCAQVLDVPVLHCLSRRLLGKALQMTMKQSVVAVFDPNGATYDLFRRMVNFVRPPNP